LAKTLDNASLLLTRKHNYDDDDDDDDDLLILGESISISDVVLETKVLSRGVSSTKNKVLVLVLTKKS